MKVGIIGSGGREHAICEHLFLSKKVNKIFCFPGNAGTKKIAINVDFDLKNLREFKNFILENKIDLIIVGPEKPLVNGIVDFLEKNNINVFGPNKKASKLEGSKIFTKKICKKFKIPTANFKIFKNLIDTNKYLKNSKYPLVIKADNLASGKGVYICKKYNDAYFAAKEIFNGKFGSTKNILIEEFIKGEEMSFFIISDGKNIKKFGTAQDHKRVLEGDKGKNTGGMGAYSPSRLINKELEKKIFNKIIKPTIKALKEMNCEYKGFLYAGLMIINQEPFLIEYNVRMGDPECQTILPLLKTNLVDVLKAYSKKELNKISIKWKNKKSICVVLCSKGYPGKFKKNVEIKNLRHVKTNKNNKLYHAGTVEKNNKTLVVGGRVLNFVSISDKIYTAREKIHKNINQLNWSNGFYRKDIGYKIIEK